MPLDVSALPCLGVGASLSFEVRPDPADLVRRRGGPAFVEYAGRLSVEDVADQVQRIRSAGVPVLFHPSYINFCGTFPNSTRWLEETARHITAVGSPWFAQDLAYCAWGGNPGYSSQFGWFIPPIFNQASLDSAVVRVREVQSVVHVPVAVEPPPMTFAVGGMPLMRFFGRLVEQVDAAVLLDAGHLVSYEMATGRRIADELHELDTARVVEVHVAGGRVEGTGPDAIYLDAHERPILDETWRMLEFLLPRLPNLRALCFECEGFTEDDVMSTLARIRGMALEHSSSTALKAHCAAVRDVA